jgi:enamine deaminase RidA (YjgF/YER057c/UK114 family)
MTWFITDKAAYKAGGAAMGAAYKEIIGRHFPTITVIFVSALVDDRAKVEIEATAFING